MITVVLFNPFYAILSFYDMVCSIKTVLPAFHPSWEQQRFINRLWPASSWHLTTWSALLNGLSQLWIMLFSHSQTTTSRKKYLSSNIVCFSSLIFHTWRKGRKKKIISIASAHYRAALAQTQNFCDDRFVFQSTEISRLAICSVWFFHMT